MAELEVRPCAYCWEPYYPWRRDQRYCSPECARKGSWEVEKERQKAAKTETPVRVLRCARCDQLAVRVRPLQRYCGARCAASSHHPDRPYRQRQRPAPSTPIRVTTCRCCGQLMVRDGRPGRAPQYCSDECRLAPTILRLRQQRERQALAAQHARERAERQTITNRLRQERRAERAHQVCTT